MSPANHRIAIIRNDRVDSLHFRIISKPGAAMKTVLWQGQELQRRAGMIWKWDQKRFLRRKLHHRGGAGNRHTEPEVSKPHTTIPLSRKV